MNLPKRLPYELTIIATLLLGSCSEDGPALRTHEEIEDIASDVAEDAIADSTRISDLKSRVEELERQLR